MLLVSHYLLSATPIDFPKESVVLRINVAWIKNKKELLALLGKIKHDVYLDYPQGRSKPPKPKMTLGETIAVVNQFPNIKYFAVSNVEDPEAIFAIKSKLPEYVEVVPKIETKLGVKNMEKIVRRLGTKYVMLDKEDLYIDVNRNSKAFENMVASARKKAHETDINLLELHGVVFLPYKNDLKPKLA
ncbi:MAG: aldolase/citrate lyase family protein [bacterium]|nr:aldolase/citrate lyase family protein [bacterium]